MLNVIVVEIISATQDVKVCQGFSRGLVFYLESFKTGIRVAEDIGFDVSFNVNVIRCCKDSNSQQNWCDFLMDDQLCKSIYHPGPLNHCLTGTLQD